MATARKLPSGSWRVQVYSHTEDGKKIRKSFTCDDPSPKGKRIVEAAAAAWAAQKEQHSRSSGITFKQAAEDYIASRTAVCSPRTIEEYTAYISRHLEAIAQTPIDRITRADLQKLVNSLSKGRSPKTVRNIYGFVVSVIHIYHPELSTSVKLPQTKHAELHIPDDAEISRIIEAAEGTTLELPILLAAFGPMRRGEICALQADDIDGNIAHVHRNMVRKTVNSKKIWITKEPKSAAGTRFIEYPDFVAQKWQGKTGRIVDICPDTITKSFGILLSRLHIEPFRFHDLRHYSASIQHALGIPDAYIMQRGGWSSDRVLKAVYRHTLDDQTKQMTERINQHFSMIGSHESSHESESPQ